MNDDRQRVIEYVRPTIRRMEGYQSGEQPQGGKFVKLNTNENPYDPSEKVLEAIRVATGGGLKKYPDATAATFRSVAARHWNVAPDWILCGNGSDEILTILMRSFVGAGGAVRWPTPTYVLYPVLTQLQDGRADPVPFSPDWSLPEAFFRPCDGLRMVVVANPNSPSGTLVARDQIARLCESLPCPVVIDEAYADFARTSCIDLIRDYPNLIVTRTMSKSFALAGLRFGYVVARPELIEQMNKVRDSYNCDSLSIAGATAALDDANWLAQTIDKILATRTRLQSSLADLGFEITPSSANFVWCSHVSGNRAIYEKLRQHQILVRYMSYEGWGDGIRITVGTDDQADALITVLKQIL